MDKYERLRAFQTLEEMFDSLPPLAQTLSKMVDPMGLIHPDEEPTTHSPSPTDDPQK